MNTTYKYDPEDIESLLMHKQFNELYPEEKEFVLRHVEGPEEYESLRQTLFLMHDAADQDEWLEPDPSIRKNLMAQFVTEEKKGFFVWLNGLFVAPLLPEMPWYRKPAMRLAFASVALVAVVGSTWYYVSRSTNTSELAQTEHKSAEDAAKQSPGGMEQEGKRTYADNLKPNVFPPAPAPVDVPMEYPQVEYIPTEESAAIDLAPAGNATLGLNNGMDESDDAPEMESPAAAPALEPALAEKTRNEEFKDSYLTKESKKDIDLKKENAETLVATDKVVTSEQDFASDESVDHVVISDQNTALTAPSSSPVLTNSGSSTFTIQPGLLSSPLANTYKWDLTTVQTNSRNAADLKPLVSVLFTAK